MERRHLPEPADKSAKRCSDILMPLSFNACVFSAHGEI